MKDSEFIEILNLYLDHEICESDAARLEAEVGRNPERRRIYRQYCRMHKACIVMAENPSGEAPAAWEIEASAAPWWRGWNTGAYAAGLLAAAAVLVIVLARPHPAALAPEVSVAVARPDRPVTPPVAAVAVSNPARAELQPVFTVRSLTPMAEDAGFGSLASPQLNDQFAWMNRVQLAPIQSAPLGSTVFDTPPAIFSTDNRALQPTLSLRDSVERASFQIQK